MNLVRKITANNLRASVGGQISSVAGGGYLAVTYDSRSGLAHRIDRIIVGAHSLIPNTAQFAVQRVLVLEGELKQFIVNGALVAGCDVFSDTPDFDARVLADLVIAEPSAQLDLGVQGEQDKALTVLYLLPYNKDQAIAVARTFLCSMFVAASQVSNTAKIDKGQIKSGV